MNERLSHRSFKRVTDVQPLASYSNHVKLSFLALIFILLSLPQFCCCMSIPTEQENQSYIADFGNLNMAFAEGMHSRGNIPQGVAYIDPLSSEAQNSDILFIVDRILEPQTVSHFLEFTMFGRLPTGAETAQPLLTLDDVALLQQPYAEWAPGDYGNLKGSTIENIFMRIGSHEDNSRLTVITKDIHALKSRLWEGIVPLSERRWNEMQLDESENFGRASEFLSAVVNVFGYLNQGEIRDKLKETYNLIYDHLDDFEKALHAFRISHGISGQNPSITQLWAEFVKGKWEYIAIRSHQWILGHANRLKEGVTEQIRQHQNTLMTYDAKQWEYTNKIHDLTEIVARADYTILMPLDGYKGINLTSGHADIDSNLSGSYPIAASPNLEERKKAYGARMKYLSRMKMAEDILKREDNEQQHLPISDPRSILKALNNQKEGQDQTRRELRGEEKSEMQVQWVHDLKRSAHQKEWGFVGYRIYYGHSDAEWEEFMKNFETNIENWGEELTGLDGIRVRSKVQWYDGRKFGIAENDIDAAKK
jgi:hypothetical protein